MSLLPMDMLEKYLVPAYEEGIAKYYRESWRKGFYVSDMVDAAQRHITDFFWKREDIDPDSPTCKHHLAGAIFSLITILHTLETRPELDDRKPMPETDEATKTDYPWAHPVKLPKSITHG